MEILLCNLMQQFTCLLKHKDNHYQKKSVVIHVGSKTKCVTPCPELKVHMDQMHKAESVRYLGNIVTSQGGVAETLQDRAGAKFHLSRGS